MSIASYYELGRRVILLIACNLAIAICLSTMIGQIGAPTFFLLELLVSILPQILLSSAIVAVISFRWHPRMAGGVAAITVLASLPFMTFSKFQSPNGAECQPGECLTVLTINLWGEPDFLPALSFIVDDYELDILAINEGAEISANPSLGRYFFPRFDTAIHATSLTMPRGMGIPISLFSSVQLANSAKVLRPDTGRRAYIFADLDGQWDGVRVVAAHARTPVSQSGLAHRNALLSAVGEVAEQADSFVILGDFNLTAWSPTFRSLPGSRAGDPRFSTTWPRQFPPLGMAIDHIMFSDDLELVEYQVLGSIGSDHFPILAKFKRKTRL